MNTARPSHYGFIRMFICILVLGVACLAIRAKASQYPNGPGLSRHFFKNTKMSDDRLRSHAAVPLAGANAMPAVERQATFPLEPAPAVEVRSHDYFPSPWSRPPPARSGATAAA